MQYILDDIVDVEVEVVIATPIFVDVAVELPLLIIRIQENE